jgi:phosphatidylinositol-3-phosphatase
VVHRSWCSEGAGSLPAMVMRRSLTLVAVMLGVLGAAGSASAATTCKTVAHKVHSKHWVWRKEVRKVHGHLRVVRIHGKIVYHRVRVSYLKTEHKKVCRTTPAGTTTPAPTSPAPHVMVIVEENRNRGEVIGAADMPYFNSLAVTYGDTTDWDGVAHPSLPNYLALVSGSTQGVTNDGTGYSFPSVPTLGSQLTAAGISWKAYMEDMPGPASGVGESGEYVKKHNPFAYFPQTNGPNVVPATQFQADLAAGKLPDFIWYTPNLINDGHELSNAAVDASLKGILEPLLASTWYAESGIIVITWDEDQGEQKTATVVVAEVAKGKILTAPGNNYGTLATIEDLYKLPRLGKAAGAQTLASLIS